MRPSAATLTRRIREKVAADPTSIERWRVYLDEKRLDDEGFLGLFRISTEDELVGGERPFFKYRLIQTELSKLQDELEFVRGVFAEIRIPKSRKHGVSRQTTSRYGFARIMRRAGYVTIIVAQDNDSAVEHFERLTELFDQVDWDALRALGYERIEATKRSIVVKHPNGYNSIVRVRTASKRGLGRGATPNAILLTERGNAWSAEAERSLPGLLMSQRRVRGNVLIDESTAGPEGNGFHADCLRAHEGRGDARLLFFESYKHPLNYRPFASAQDAELFRAKLGNAYYGEPGEEEDLLARVTRHWAKKLGDDAAARALEFLHWRRFQIDGPCRGSIDTLHRDEPTTFEEAFHGSGRPVYDVRVLRTWTLPAQVKQRTAQVGQMRETSDSATFDLAAQGPIRVYRPPQTGKVYCWGMDVASGQRFLSGSGSSADWTVVNLKDAYTGITVAKLRAHMKAPDVTLQLILLARWYNYAERAEPAQGLIELGGGWGDGIVNTVIAHEAGIWQSIMLTSAASAHATSQLQRETTYGFKASSQGKHILKNEMEAFILETGEYAPPKSGETERECPWDFDTLQELKLYSYVVSEETQKPQMKAATGHDDCAVAEMLAQEARSRLLANGSVPLASPVTPPEPDPHKRFLKGLGIDVTATAARPPSPLGRGF